jgi:hypothetical protein
MKPDCPKLSVLFLFAFALLMLAGCSAMQKGGSTQSTQDLETREKIRQLQEKLSSLQEQLAVMEAQKTFASVRKPESPPAWDPLLHAGEEKPGYGLFTYLLDRKGAGEQARNLLSQVLDGITALPGRTDLPEEETNRFLVPLKDVAASPDAAHYNAELAGSYMDLLDFPGPGKNGPLLVSSYRPLGKGEKNPLLILELAGCDSGFLTRVLPAYLGNVETVAGAEDKPFAKLFWQLVEQAEPDSITVARVGRFLVLGCPR